MRACSRCARRLCWHWDGYSDRCVQVGRLAERGRRALSSGCPDPQPAGLRVVVHQIADLGCVGDLARCTVRECRGQQAGAGPGTVHRRCHLRYRARPGTDRTATRQPLAAAARKRGGGLGDRAVAPFPWLCAVYRQSVCRAIEAFDTAIDAFDIVGDRWEQVAAMWQKALCLGRLGQLHDAGSLARDTYWEAKRRGDRIGAGTALAIWVRYLPAKPGARPGVASNRESIGREFVLGQRGRYTSARWSTLTTSTMSWSSSMR